MKYHGLILILSSPSGAGKTSIIEGLLKIDSNVVLSVSMTTRSSRKGEIDGENYHFIDQKTYHEMVEKGEFLEHAKVFENFYGSPKAFAFDQLKKGKDIVFDVDWQGAKQIAKSAKDNVVSIFILPPSLEELKNRIYNRGLDKKEILQHRMSLAISEISHFVEYDYVIINKDLEKSVEEVFTILKAERLKRTRQTDLSLFVENLKKTDASF
ncbi:MAG: guanylate kinase [Alphaproteobacteria bacterium]